MNETRDKTSNREYVMQLLSVNLEFTYSDSHKFQ